MARRKTGISCGGAITCPPSRHRPSAPSRRRRRRTGRIADHCNASGRQRIERGSDDGAARIADTSGRLLDVINRSPNRRGRRRTVWPLGRRVEGCRPNTGRPRDSACAHSPRPSPVRLTIHLTPNLSVHIPKRGDQNVLSSGMVIDPPAASFEKISSVCEALSV